MLMVLAGGLLSGLAGVDGLGRRVVYYESELVKKILNETFI